MSFSNLKKSVKGVKQEEKQVVYEFDFSDTPDVDIDDKDKPEKDILTEDIFLKLLKQEYINEIKNKYEYNKTWISVGDIVKECPLPTIFRFLDNDYDIETLSFYPYTMLITKVGSALHEHIQNMLSKLYDNVEIEIRLEYEPLNLKGFIDLKYELDKQLILGEIKTISQDELVDPNFKGRDYHWKQVTMYSYLYEKMFDKKPDFIQLIYVLRDFKPKKEDKGKIEPIKIFTAVPDVLYTEYIDSMLENIDIIRTALKEKKIPKSFSKEKKNKIKKAGECFFCPYKHKCPLFKHRRKVKEIDIQL